MMNLEEAIKHCEEVADEQKKLAEKWEAEGGSEYGKTMACKRCAEEHHQLAEWLMDYKRLKEERGFLSEMNTVEGGTMLSVKL